MVCDIMSLYLLLVYHLFLMTVIMSKDNKGFYLFNAFFGYVSVLDFDRT